MLPAIAAAVTIAATADSWPYAAPVNWSFVPSFVFSTVQTTIDSSSGVATVEPEELAFLSRFPLIIMPKIQGPNTPNLTDPLHPAPACCAEDRILAAAAAIKKASTAAHRAPPPRVLLYFQSARLFPYYRLTRSFDDAMLLDFYPRPDGLITKFIDALRLNSPTYRIRAATGLVSTA